MMMMMSYLIDYMSIDKVIAQAQAEIDESFNRVK